MTASKLYSPEVLALAASLSRWPWDPSLGLTAEARSRSCGSTLALGLGLGPDGAVSRVGLQARACAIGQAACAIFAARAPGLTLGQIAEDAGAVAAWLAGQAALPDIAGLRAIAPAREHPARHGAIMLAWTAARELLSSRAA